MNKLDWLYETVARKIAFSARKTGGDQTINNNADTTVAFDAEDFNYGGCFSGNTFTAPVDGLYLFSARVHWDLQTAGYRHLYFSTPAGQYGRLNETVPSGNSGYGYIVQAITSVIYLTAGQTCVVVAYHNYSGGNRTLFGGNGTYGSHFCGAKI